MWSGIIQSHEFNCIQECKKYVWMVGRPLKKKILGLTLYITKRNFSQQQPALMLLKWPLWVPSVRWNTEVLHRHAGNMLIGMHGSGNLVQDSIELPVVYGGVTGFLGRLKISLCEERRLKDTQNLNCEDRRFQNCLVLKTWSFGN